MKKLTFLLVTIIFVFIACTTEDKVDNKADIEAIKSISVNVAKAFNEGDYEGFMTFFDDNAILLPQNTRSIVGIQSIGSLYSNSFENFTFNVDNIIEEITVSGDYGYELGNWVGAIIPNDGSMQTDFNNKIMCIYNRQTDGSWKIYRWMYSSNEIPEELLSPELTD